MRDHLLRDALKNFHGIKCGRDAVQHALLKFVAGDRLAVAAAGTVEFVDRQPLLAVGAAIAILAGDRIKLAARPAKRITTEPRLN